MADDQDKSQKTEDPTAKRLEDAFKKGNVPKSQEVNHWFMLAGSGLAVAIFAGNVAAGLQPMVVQFLQLPHDIPIDVGHLSNLFGEIGFGLMKLLALPLTVLVVAAIAGNMIQHKPAIAWEKLKPELKKISPVSGAQRLFGPRGAVEVLKAIAKIALIGSVAVIVIWPDLQELRMFVRMELIDIVKIVEHEALWLLIAVLSVLTVIAATDLVYQRYDWTQNLKMSRQDVRDENKQAEGDPHIKARIRQIRAERSRQRIAAAVPTADVVITNPTHYAVALKYDAETMAAPTVVAKGQDLLAKRIRELATENDVPLVENPPLARGLYAAVEIDQEVSPEFYKAVAEVISYVMRLSKARGSARAAIRPPKPTIN
jgi:flagellar biosynthetic protein FlhB